MASSNTESLNYRLMKQILADSVYHQTPDSLLNELINHSAMNDSFLGIIKGIESVVCEL